MRKIDEGIIREIQKYRGMASREISTITGVGINTVCKHMLDKRIEKNWTEREMDLITKHRALGKTHKQIAAMLGRTPNSVRIQFCRYRKLIMSDECKRKALKYLMMAVEMGARPSEVVTVVKRAKIF